MTTTTETTGERGALTRIAEMRAILARAGRRDLADLAWAQLCPAGVPLQVRYDALTMAGYPFRAEAGETGISEREALVIAALDEAAADRDERARGSGCLSCGLAPGKCPGHREDAQRAAEYRAERDRREAGRG